LEDAFVAVHQQMLAGPKDHRCLGEDIPVVIVLQPGIKGRGHSSAHIQGRRFLAGLGPWPLVLHDLHNAVAVRDSLIDGQFVERPNADDEGDRHAGSEPEDVDKGVAAVPAQLADGKKEIVFEHAIGFRLR